MLQSLGRTLYVWSKGVMPYGVTFPRCADIHKTYSDAVLSFFFQVWSNSKKCTFKTDQIELLVVIEYKDFEIAKMLWAEHEDGIASMVPMNPGYVVSHGLMCLLTITYISYLL